MLLHGRTTTTTTSTLVFTFLLVSITRSALCAKVKGFVDGSGEVVAAPRPPLELDQLQLENFLVGISADGVRLSNDTDSQCAWELGVFLDDLKKQKQWALKVVDAFGSTPKSIGWGNYFWFTAKEYCQDLNDPYQISLSERYHHTKRFNISSPFPVRFWMVYFNFTTPQHVDLNLQFENKIHAGLCLPKSCTYDEVVAFSESYFSKKIFEPQRRFDIEMNAIGAKTPEFRFDIFSKTGFLLLFGVLGSLAALIIIAEIIYRIHKNYTENKNSKVPTDEYSRVEEFFLCFDLKDNYQRLLQLENSKGFLPAIAGFRTIVCLWVTLFHVYFYSLFATSNVPLIFAKLEKPALQPVLQSCFYVDVFFVISSFLMCFNFLSNTRNIEAIRANSLKDNIKFFLKVILQRYVRLLPIMLITMIMSDCLHDFLDMYSPFRMDQYTGLYCKKNWWYNVLFINNFLNLKDISGSWTWYLSCEMQFFILFTLILFIYAKNKSVGKTVFVVLLMSFLSISLLCNYFNDVTFQIDVIYGTLEQLYVKPWVRINPYFAGAFIGWIFYRHKNNPIQINTQWRVVFWVFTFFVYATTNFMTYWRNTPTWLVAPIMSLGKLVFGLCIGWVFVMCEWGYGGLLNSVMSSRPFLFLNKFCFSIYMIAPVIVVTVFGLRTEATHFNEVGSAMDFIGVIVLSILISFIIVLLIEIPVSKISSKFIIRKPVK